MSIAQAQRQTEDFAGRLDEALPGRCSGLYLVGSVALGDWNDKVSNLDLVVVADDPWTDAELATASRLHRHLAVADEEARVLYTTFPTLALPVAEGTSACFEGRAAVDRGELDTALTRAVLGEDAVAVRGSEWITVAGGAEGDLRAWGAARLAGRWQRWSDARRGPGSLWKRKPLGEAVLEVCRVHVAATRGQAVSKLRAGPLALEDVSTRFERAVADASGFRQGSRTSMYWGPAERKANAVDLVRALAALA